MFLRLDYYLKRLHLFKQRYASPVICSIKTLNLHTIFISVKKQRFNFVYVRTVRKLLRRKYCKAKMRFFRPRLWIFLNINCILSCKSKNARMGAGVGKLVRLVTILYPQTIFLSINYGVRPYLIQVCNFLSFKCGIECFFKLNMW